MWRKGQLIVAQNFTLYDPSTHPISSPLQPLTSGQQSLCVITLLARLGAAVYNAHSERCHVTVEPGQLG
jgi:hypothetical protein